MGYVDLNYNQTNQGRLEDTASSKQQYTPVVVSVGGQGDGFRLTDVQSLLAALQGPISESPYQSNSIRTGSPGLSLGGVGGLSINPWVLALIGGGVLWLTLRKRK